MWDPFAEFEMVRLSNGLALHSVHWAGRPWIALGFVVYGGASHDPVDREGLAHFVEHVVSGSGPVSQEQIRLLFEECGGDVNFGETSYHATEYRCFLPVDERVIAIALSALGGALIDARIDRVVEQERRIILAEFKKNFPVQTAYDLVVSRQTALHHGTWFERFARPIGSFGSIQKITKDDLQKCHETFYTPSNISIVTVGGMSLVRLSELFLASPFGSGKAGARALFSAPEADACRPVKNRYVFNPSSAMRAAMYDSRSRIPGRFSQAVVDIGLGMLNELLWKEVRENRAWAYGIRASCARLPGFYEWTIASEALDLDAVDGIDDVVDSCVRRMATDDGLLERARRREIASLLMVDRSGRGIRDDAMSDIAMCQRITSLTERRAALEGVCMNDMVDLAQFIGSDRRYSLLVAPGAEGKRSNGGK